MAIKNPEKVQAEICRRMAEGESLRSVCRDDKMPGLRTVMEWLDDKDRFPNFPQQYARAANTRADAMFEEILEISDAATPENVSVARLKVDSRKWATGKMNPKKYGDKPESPVNINVNPKEPASDEDLASAVVNIIMGSGAKLTDD